jgi:hypothetical protein
MSKVMKDKAKKTTNTKDMGKVFDVTRPGKTTVSATSRPVIVGHKPQVKDPMMAKHDDEKQTLLDSTQKVTARPFNGAEKPTEQNEHSSPTGAPPVPDGLDAVAEAGPSPNIASPDETEAPTFASVAVTSAVEKPHSEPTAPELQSDLAADILDNDTPTDTAQLKETPEASDQAQPSLELAEPEVPSPVSTISDQAPEKNNGTVGVVFEEPTSVRRPMEIPEGADPLPVLPDEPIPQTIIVAHHTPKAGAGKIFFIILLVLIFAAIILDVLLDAGFVVLDGIPHTDFF